jgi:opacity protein-like surface antigen
MVLRTLFLSFVLVAAGGFTASARMTLSGEEQRSAFSLGGRGAYFDPDDGDGTWFGGAQGKFYLGPALGVEGSIDYRKSDFGSTDVHVYPVQASLLAYLIPESWVSPYLLAGGGWYFTSIEGPGGFDETEHRFGWHAGGGAQLFLNRFWSVDATYRYLWVEDFASRDDNLTAKDYEEAGHMITTGLNFHF